MRSESELNGDDRSVTRRLRTELANVVGPAHVLTEPDMVAGYVTDWTGAWTGRTRAVVRPGTVGEVQHVVSLCRDAGLPIVPQGGNTGLVGGSVPHGGEVVLSMRRLNRLEPVDPISGQVTAGAGVTIAALRDHVRSSGFDYGVDLASRDSATVGGTVATNAGGIRVIANGDTRRQVLGLEVVLADGTMISRLAGIEKDSAGFDLSQLFVGSEGTLGVITSARLRLTPLIARQPYVVLLGVSHPSHGLQLRGPGVIALEFLSHTCLALVAGHLGRRLPTARQHPYYVLVESTGVPELDADVDGVVDQRLWDFRESITETLSTRGVPHKFDVGVPLAHLDRFVEDLGHVDGDVFVFGHLAEGNCHVNVLGPTDYETVADQVYGLVVENGGTVASEHGIGIAKSRWLHLITSPEEQAVIRRIKQALDPERILNPAVTLFPLE
jgi:FAD/FMN-containing dehydrogenase